MKYTPAPWTASRSFSPARINKVAANKILVADCYASERTPEEQEANARLIAASPIMFEYIQRKAQSGDKEAQDIIKTLA